MQHVARGFTLMELLVTLTILSVLAMSVLPFAQVTHQRGKEQELRQALHTLRHAIDAYKRASDEGRIEKKAGHSGYPENLEKLVEGVIDVRDPKRRKLYFLRRIPRDPFNPDNELSAEDSWLKRSYASEPDNPTEGEDVFDVISMSTTVGLNGIPYKQW